MKSRVPTYARILLHSVKEGCRLQMLENIGSGYLERGSQVPFVVGYRFMLRTWTNGVADLDLLGRAGIHVSRRLLATAVAALEEMIESIVEGAVWTLQKELGLDGWILVRLNIWMKVIILLSCSYFTVVFYSLEYSLK